MLDAVEEASMSRSRRMKGIFWFSEAVKQDPTIDVWLNDQAPELGALARTWFQRMRECGLDVRELMHDGSPTACVEGAAFGYVHVFRTHANVGFFHGAELDDPTGLLQGTGKRMRHVKVKPGGDLDAVALAALISNAYVDMKQRLAEENGVSSASSRPREGRRRRPTRG
jgi:hypothetical protein